MTTNEDQSVMTTPRIGFDHVLAFPGWDEAPDYLLDVLNRSNAKSLLEVGSGAEPTLSLVQFEAAGLQRYVTNDIDADELLKAPAGFETLHADLAATPTQVERGSFDLIFSRMVNEHIVDGESYHRNLFDALTPGGLAVHCFATLYNLPMLINKITPHRLSEPMLHLVNPRTKPNQGVFPAHYSWSRGPTPKMLERLTGIGYEIERYTGYFGHLYYRAKLAPLHALEMRKTDWLLAHPSPHLCAYAVVELRKP